MHPIKVLVADAQFLFADAVANALMGSARLEVLPELPGSGIEAIEVAGTRHPDVILLDYWLEGMDGPAVARAVLGRSPTTKVVFLSWFHGPPEAAEAMKAGAAGLLAKSLLVGELEEAIARAHAGDSPLVDEPEATTAVAVSPARERDNPRIMRLLSTLTPRELELLRLISIGQPLDKIAERLGITLMTTRTHVHNILGKTEANSQVEAVALGAPPRPDPIISRGKQTI